MRRRRRRSLSRSLPLSRSPSLLLLVLSSYVTGQLAFRYVARGRRHFTWTLFKVGKLVNFSAARVRPSVGPSLCPTAPAGLPTPPPPVLGHLDEIWIALESRRRRCLMRCGGQTFNAAGRLSFRPNSSMNPRLPPLPPSLPPLSVSLHSSPRVIAKTERAKVCLYSRTYIWPISAVAARGRPPPSPPPRPASLT